MSTAADTRLVLLNAYREDLRSGRSRADSGLDETTRASALDGLEAVALVSLGKPSKVEDVDAAVRDLLELDLDARLTVEYGQRLGVLESRYDDVVRFGHPTTLAYFASCYLAKRKDDRDLWERALTAADLGSAAGLAFVFANAAAGDPELARSTSIQLLDRLDQATNGNNGPGDLANPNERLQILNTAEEIARRNGAWSGELASASSIAHARNADLGAIPREQVRLIEELGSIHSQRAYETLWGIRDKGAGLLGPPPGDAGVAGKRRRRRQVGPGPGRAGDAGGEGIPPDSRSPGQDDRGLRSTISGRSRGSCRACARSAAGRRLRVRWTSTSCGCASTRSR